MPNFFLRKWYLDAADDSGNVYIGYWASVRWRKLRLHFYQHLSHTATQGVQVQSGLSRQPEPYWLNSDTFVWQADGVDALWQSLAGEVQQTLLCNEQGEINWRCTQPKAHADIKLPQLSFRGYGYTECIEITIPVWNLPFDTLYWGRSHTANHYVIWIQWGGATQQSLVWHNGVCSKDLTITDSQIYGTDFQLQLGEDIQLRQGQLGSTVFQPFSHITKRFPEKVLGVYEQKWYNQSKFVTEHSTEKAVTIYETVNW